jgi:uncharacterized protein with PQ loop repeat
MNCDTGYAFSFSGFVDYWISYPSTDIWWFITGACCFAGTWISIFPQYYAIVAERSSFGLDSITLFVMLFAQWLLVANIVCLRAEDFVGIFQYSFSIAISRMLTFVNALSNWISYLPVVFMNHLFFDLVPRPLRDSAQINKEMRLNKLLLILNPIAAGATFLIMWVLGFVYGYGSRQIVILGKVFGFVAAVLWAAQYLPQMWTTWKLQSPGNLSLLLLAIQSPGGFVNSVFMAIGQKDDWTTWVASFAAAVQQLLLLIECLYFKWKAQRNAVVSEEKVNPLMPADWKSIDDLPLLAGAKQA